MNEAAIFPTGTRTAAAGSALPSMVLSRLGIKVAALEAQLTNAQAEKDAAAKRAEEQKQVGEL